MKEIVYGSWITIPHPQVSEIMSLSGFDFLVLDMQHSVIDFNVMQDMIRSISSGIKKYVRIDNNPYSINKCLDSGIDGIIIPNVNDIDDITEIISSIKYPPIGKRSSGLCRAQNYGLNFDEYYKDFNQKVKIIIQIETEEGLDNFEEIISNSEINGYIIGPYDLSSNLNLTRDDIDNGKINEIELGMIDISKKHDKICGYHIVYPTRELIKNKINMGYDFVILSVDNILLLNSCKQLKDIRGLENELEV